MEAKELSSSELAYEGRTQINGLWIAFRSSQESDHQDEQNKRAQIGRLALLQSILFDSWPYFRLKRSIHGHTSQESQRYKRQMGLDHSHSNTKTHKFSQKWLSLWYSPSRTLWRNPWESMPNPTIDPLGSNHQQSVPWLFSQLWDFLEGTRCGLE